MSKEEYYDFGKKLAFHTAPTLMGIKCASLVCLSRTEFELEVHLRIFNRRASAKGLKIRPLYGCEHRTLLLVYNERKLRERLAEPETAQMLSSLGYRADIGVEGMLERLSERIEESSGFPHEIGLFLDYPTEDVLGFIRNNGENYKLCGCWKVYGSEERAKRMFANYEKCRKFLFTKLNEGSDIYQALKIS